MTSASSIHEAGHQSWQKAGALGQPRGIGREGRWEWGSVPERHMYTYGQFMLICGKDHHNIGK